jgi:hypothetical protein
LAEQFVGFCQFTVQLSQSVLPYYIEVWRVVEWRAVYFGGDKASRFAMIVCNEPFGKKGSISMHQAPAGLVKEGPI